MSAPMLSAVTLFSTAFDGKVFILFLTDFETNYLFWYEICFGHSRYGVKMQIKIIGSHSGAYGKAIQKMDHNVVRTGLFSDPLLVRAIDAHPGHLLSIYTQSALLPCSRGSSSGAVLLEAVRRGDLSIHLRGLESLKSHHGKLVGILHGAFNRHMGLRTTDRNGTLVISSPRARLGYEISTADTSLWHLRGRKRIYIYPNRAPFVRPQHVQQMALQNKTEKIPYKREFETDSIGIDLEPGEVICWPHLSPYRVDNLEAINVSLSLESLTKASRRRMSSYFFDGYINRAFGTHLASTQPGSLSGFSKTMAAGAIKKVARVRAQRRQKTPQFKVNLAYPNCLEPL